MDMVLKEVRDGVLLKYQQWLRTGLWNCSEIRDKAVENEDIARRRAKLKAFDAGGLS